MTFFAIDTDNNITTYPAAEKIPEGQERFTSEKELAALAANWPADRLISVWNSFAGVAGFGADLKPVKKFTNRKTAIARIWKAIQKLDGVSEGAATATAEAAAAATPAKAAPKTPKGAQKAAKGAPTKAKATKTAKSAKKATGASVPREFSKKAAVIDMLRRKGGATLEEIAKATDWQSHTIRGFVSGTLTKKMGLAVESAKNADGARYYRITSK
jgi:cell pole-organizing protein PopZ